METFKKSMLIILIAIVVMVVLGVGIFFLSFKTSYLSISKIYANEYRVDTALVMSVIKAESKFNPKAKSKANAIGLMQIKLDTANYMLQKLGETEITETELFDPKTNIKIGTKYLQYLLNKFDNVEVVICAYNAGETVVSSWLKDNNCSSDGKTLKQIPFAETSHYLKKVMFNYSVYKKIIKV